MLKRKVAEIALNLFFSSIALFAIIIASGYSSFTSTRLGAKTFPTMISVLLIIFAVSNIIKAILKKEVCVNTSINRDVEEKKNELPHETALGAFVYRYRIFIVILVSFVYYFLLYSVGFIISTLIFIPVMLLVLEYRKPLMIGIVTIASTAFMILSFQILLRVPLPVGIIFK